MISLPSRRPAVRSSGPAPSPALGLLGSNGLAAGPAPAGRRGPGSADPGDPEVPNEQVARILKELFGDRPIGKGHISLDMPVVAEDGRIVPVIIESDLPMTAEHYVKAVHLIVDHNPDPHLAAYHLTPALGSVALPDPHQDEAHHLGPGDSRDLDRRGVGGLRARQRLAERVRLMTIGDARIRIPDRIARGDLIIVNAIVVHPMDTGFFRTARRAADPGVLHQGRRGDVRRRAGGPVRVDLRREQGSDRELHAQGGQGGAAHDGLDRLEGRGLPAVRQHRVRRRVALSSRGPAGAIPRPSIP